MPTGTVLLPIEGWLLADGSSNNAAPALNILTSTDASNPKARHWSMAFDDTVDEHMSVQFRLPVDYSSGGTFKFQFVMVSATANEVRWGIAVQAVTPGDGDLFVSLDPVGEGGGWTMVDETVPGTADTLDEVTITPAMDSAAAGDFILVELRREASHANDDATGDAVPVAMAFEYTTT